MGSWDGATEAEAARRADQAAYPRGWFAVAPSAAVTATASTVRFFGRDIVLFRGESGRAYAVDPYCPHLGAHLGGGLKSEMKVTVAPLAFPENADVVQAGLWNSVPKAAGVVVGEEIACPFHGWRFDGATGKCAGIPYSEKCPGAKLTTWPTTESDGWVGVWHGRVEELQWSLPVVDHADWTPLRDAVYTFPAHFLDVLENSADPVHFNSVHGSRNARQTREPEIYGHVRNSWAAFEAPVHGVSLADSSALAQTLPNAWAAPGPLHGPRSSALTLDDLQTERESRKFFVGVEAHFQLVGVGYICVRSEVAQFGIKMRNFFYVTPVDERIVQVVVRSQVHKSAPPEVEALYYAATLRDFEADVAIWEHKIRFDKPVLVPEDGPIHEYRRWARQFF